MTTHVTEVARLREKGHVTEVVTSRKGEWSCYRGHFNGRKNGHVTEVANLKEGEWLCYKDGQFNGGSMVMLLRWPINGERMSFYRGGHFNGGRMIMLRRRPV